MPEENRHQNEPAKQLDTTKFIEQRMTNNITSRSHSFKLGEDLNINRLGYGAMRLSGQPGNFGAYPEWDKGEELLRRAVELGVNFIDTAEAYGSGLNEGIIASALHPYSDDLVIATKGGINKTAPDSINADASPEFLRSGVEGSLQRLKLEQIDLYQLHRPDPKVPFTESIGALKELQDEGKICYVGLSNVSVEQIKQAQEIVPIVSVQNKYSIINRTHQPVLDYCTENNIAFIPHGSLGAHPLKRGAPLAKATGVLTDIATEKGVKPNQIALAWLLHSAPNIILIPGTTTIAHLEENMTATEIELTPEEISQLNRVEAK